MLGRESGFARLLAGLAWRPAVWRAAAAAPVNKEDCKPLGLEAWRACWPRVLRELRDQLWAEGLLGPAAWKPGGRAGPEC